MMWCLLLLLLLMWRHHLIHDGLQLGHETRHALEHHRMLDWVGGARSLGHLLLQFMHLVLNSRFTLICVGGAASAVGGC